ncbi:MAG TPA: DoxX family protein [Beutenbergiaceae bacterium]|nr:DoxX family protein [Beutenbergiaceae bacterium]
MSAPTAPTPKIAPPAAEEAPVPVDPRERIADWAAQHGVDWLRVSMGVVFLLFGAWKFFPGVSPAEVLVTRTLETLTFGILHGTLAMVLVATLETFIGLTLITGRMLGFGLAALGMAMVGFFAPLVLFYDDLLGSGPTLEAQYIVKDIVLAAAALIIAIPPLRGQTKRKNID